MPFRTSLRVVAAIAPIALSCEAQSAPPNVVLILSDDQGWSDYGFMGHAAIETPRLDRLATESLTFTRGYVTTSLCSPSLATIITGLYPAQHGVTGNDPAWRDGMKRRSPEANSARNRDRAKMIACIDRVDTIPERLADRGYLSLQTGKWWLGSYARGGFTHGMTRGFPEPGGRHGDDGLIIGREGIGPITEFLDRARDSESPFFLWYAPFLPHTPHTPPRHLLEKYATKTDSLPIAKYWAMCEWFDQTCGELLDAIDARGLTEDTVVIYVTDNGWINRPDSSRYAPRSKRSPYDGGLRTPIMVRWSGRVAPRIDETTLVSSIDLAPTVYEACGVPLHEELPGISLLDQEALERRDQVFGAIYAHDIADLDRPSASLLFRWTIRGGTKLIVPGPKRGDDASPELYRVLDDPNERRECALQRTAEVTELAGQIDSWWSRTVRRSPSLSVSPRSP